jgi:hypothetical protein
MVLNSTNINKAKSPIILTELLEQKEEHDIWRWNPGSGFGQAHKCGVAKPIKIEDHHCLSFL